MSESIGRYVDDALAMCNSLLDDKEELVLKGILLHLPSSSSSSFICASVHLISFELAVGWCLKDNMANEGHKEKGMSLLSHISPMSITHLLLISPYNLSN